MQLLPAIVHLAIVAAIDWKKKKVTLVKSALLNLGAGKHNRSARQAFTTIKPTQLGKYCTSVSPIPS
ncbi:hypothetical protein C7B67_21665 [filamentous cyanobacterium Phorm 6]|nr:hypothetical protein C7B67_21665 [filamentous cyanobacterium Phorm 6]